jgi:hypothetical protein
VFGIAASEWYFVLLKTTLAPDAYAVQVVNAGTPEQAPPPDVVAVAVAVAVAVFVRVAVAPVVGVAVAVAVAVAVLVRVAVAAVVAVAVAVDVAVAPLSHVPLFVHQFQSGGAKLLAPVAQQMVYFEPP